MTDPFFSFPSVMRRSRHGRTRTMWMVFALVGLTGACSAVLLMLSLR